MPSNDPLELIHSAPRTWLVTGCAGFIGSHIVEALLERDQIVVGLDNLTTGSTTNLDLIQQSVTETQWQRFTFHNADLRDPASCEKAVQGVSIILHQGGLASVPLSLEKPALFHDVNVTGMTNLLEAARIHGVPRFVYASSSSVYGDDPALPKKEDRIGSALSPYALTKQINELHAGLYGRAYGLETVGLRYFNAYGPRQDPKGAYASVIPQWILALQEGKTLGINGDGETTRDFVHVKDIARANLLAGICTQLDPSGASAFNVASGESISLNQLVDQFRAQGMTYPIEVKYADFRSGDIRHSCADIGQVKSILEFEARFGLEEGLTSTVEFYEGKKLKVTAAV